MVMLFVPNESGRIRKHIDWSTRSEPRNDLAHMILFRSPISLSYLTPTQAISEYFRSKTLVQKLLVWFLSPIQNVPAPPSNQRQFLTSSLGSSKSYFNLIICRQSPYIAAVWEKAAPSLFNQTSPKLKNDPGCVRFQGPWRRKQGNWLA